MPVRNGRRDFSGKRATAALVGIQLNNPKYYLEILLKEREKERVSLLGDSGPRLLSMLEPNLKDEVRVAAMLTRSIDLGPGDFSAILPAPGHRVRLTQASAMSPPDSRALPTMPTPVIDPDPPVTAEGDQAKLPKFLYKVYGLGSSEAVTTGMHPKLPHDLIFSIIPTPGSGGARAKEEEINKELFNFY